MATCPAAQPTWPLSSRELLIVPPGGALLKSPLPKVRPPAVSAGLPLLPCCSSEDPEDARSHFPLASVPSPPLPVPFLTTVPVLGGSEGHVHCRASIKSYVFTYCGLLLAWCFQERVLFLVILVNY